MDIRNMAIEMLQEEIDDYIGCPDSGYAQGLKRARSIIIDLPDFDIRHHGEYIRLTETKTDPEILPEKMKIEREHQDWLYLPDTNSYLDMSKFNHVHQIDEIFRTRFETYTYSVTLFDSTKQGLKYFGADAKTIWEYCQADGKVIRG